MFLGVLGVLGVFGVFGCCRYCSQVVVGRWSRDGLVLHTKKKSVTTEIHAAVMYA